MRLAFTSRLRAALVVTAMAAPLAAGLLAAAQRPDLIYRNWGNRMEGLVGGSRPSPQLRVVSFVAVMEPFDRGADLTLTLQTPAAAAAASVTVTDLDNTVGYRMEASLVPKDGWAQLQPWPTAAVLKHLALGSADLGYVVTLAGDMAGEEQALHLAPAFLTHSTRRPPTSAYEFVLTARSAVTDVKFDAFSCAGSVRRLTSGVSGRDARKLFRVRLDMTSLPTGCIKLRFDGQTTGALTEVAFSHPGSFAAR
jgi:hypothetical protein